MRNYQESTHKVPFNVLSTAKVPGKYIKITGKIQGKY